MTTDSPIATWTYCKNCAKVVTPLVYISENTWKYSFGKFLESFFYNRDAIMNAPEHGCSCPMQPSSILYFGCGKLAARFTYESVQPYGVFVRRNLPIDPSFHRTEAVRQLELISMASSELFVAFDKHIEKISREARSLLGSAANRPEHLQTVISELNRIGSEVDHAAKTLQEKIASVSDKCRREGDGMVNEALFRFPWFSRRYLFMLTSAWNERLSAAGQAIVAMKKLASGASQRSDGVMGQNVPTIVGDPSTDELMEGMKRLRQLNEMYSGYNVTDLTTVLPTIPGSNEGPQDEMDYDDEFEDGDGVADLSDGLDADVLASRRRLYHTKQSSPQVEPVTQEREVDGTLARQSRPTKSLGTRRLELHNSQVKATARSVDSSSISSQSKVTPGGAVKSALTRFFNRGGREFDPYVVDLGIFKFGRPRLEPGVDGIVVPVVDEQPSTVIAYSLSSLEYANQFKHFSRAEGPVADHERSLSPEGQRKGDVAPLSSGDGGESRSRREASRSPTSATGAQLPGFDARKDIERRMLMRSKSHIKHTFRDYDEKRQQTCKFVCTTYWATQFHAVREAFLAAASPGKGETSDPNATSWSFSNLDVEKCYVQSLASAYSWAASGGKSGASFARTTDERFVIKCISRTELQMFLDCAT
jgi:1-phosphatidylinositol-3-phosphate 5-kinase